VSARVLYLADYRPLRGAASMPLAELASSAALFWFCAASFMLGITFAAYAASAAAFESHGGNRAAHHLR